MKLKPIVLSGCEVLPLVEGGKGISISNGESSGAWAASGSVGTFSAVNADAHDENGALIPVVYKGKTRRARHRELIDYAIKGAITQARIAHEISGKQGRLHMNVLWEMAGTQEILHNVLAATSDIVHGVTCGAGMPYRIAEICEKFGVCYYPIVSSARAFRVLWKRAFHKFPNGFGAVVYEDPWLAGGHNGLSNSEDPEQPEKPYARVLELRKVMSGFGLDHIPIIMAGGVWFLREWTDWIDNKELGPIAFQFGTRPLLTQESPISDAWKRKLLTLKHGDIHLNRFSPTGFYSSGVDNAFIQELIQRNKRQIPYHTTRVLENLHPFPIGVRGREVFLAYEDYMLAKKWFVQGYIHTLKTPDHTLIFVTPEKRDKIHQDQINCMGCLSACRFSNWAQNEAGTTGKKADPRSFCIQKTLQVISHGGNVEAQLMFAGHNAYKFSEDPFYQNGFIPTVKQLIERITTGN